MTILDRWYAPLENALNGLSAAAILFLMFFAVWQVVGRKLFNAPVWGYIDWVEQIMVVFVFAGAAYCQRLGGHVRMELIVSRFRGRTLWLLESFGVTVGLIVVAALISTTFDHFLRAYQLGDSTIDARLPIWPAKLLVPVALSLLWLRLLLQLVGYARLALHPSLPPEAVPLIASVEQEAAKEIRDALGGAGEHR